MAPAARRTITVKRAEGTTTSSQSSAPSIAVASSSKTESARSRKTGPSLEQQSTLAITSTGTIRPEQTDGLVVSVSGVASSSSSAVKGHEQFRNAEQEEMRSWRPTSTLTSYSGAHGPTTLATVYGVVSSNTESTTISESDFEAAFTPPEGTAYTGSGTWTALVDATAPTRPVISSYSYQVEAGLPYPPTWTIYLVSACLAAGFTAAIILYLVNFPEVLCHIRGSSRKKRHIYAEVKARDSGSDRDDAKTSSSGSSTAAFSPDAQAVRRRGMIMNRDTVSAGLGIALSPTPQTSRPDSLRTYKSFDEETSRLLNSALNPQSSAPATGWRSFTDPIPSVKTFLSPLREPHPAEEADYELRERRPDIETGLLRSPPSPAGSASSHSSCSSSSSNLSTSIFLAKIGDRVEYAADKLARILDHQVGNGDPEDGLLLPTRAFEKGKRMEHGKLKKVC